MRSPDGGTVPDTWANGRDADAHTMGEGAAISTSPLNAPTSSQGGFQGGSEASHEVVREWSYPEEQPRFHRATRFVAFIKGGGAAYTSRAVYRVLALDSDEEAYEQDRTTENATSRPKRGTVAAALRSMEATPPEGNLTIVTNDDFVVGALSRGDLQKWRANDWKKPDGEPPHALEIWKSIAKIIDERRLKITAVHSSKAPADWQREFEKVRRKKPPRSH